MRVAAAGLVVRRLATEPSAPRRAAASSHPGPHLDRAAAGRGGADPSSPARRAGANTEDELVRPTAHRSRVDGEPRQSTESRMTSRTPRWRGVRPVASAGPSATRSRSEFKRHGLRSSTSLSFLGRTAQRPRPSVTTPQVRPTVNPRAAACSTEHDPWTGPQVLRTYVRRRVQFARFVQI